MHFRKMWSAFSFLLLILVSQFSLGFIFNPTNFRNYVYRNSRIGAFRLAKRVCGNYYFRTRGIVLQIVHEYGVTFQVNGFLL